MPIIAALSHNVFLKVALQNVKATSIVGAEDQGVSLGDFTQVGRREIWRDLNGRRARRSRLRTPSDGYRVILTLLEIDRDDDQLVSGCRRAWNGHHSRGGEAWAYLLVIPSDKREIPRDTTFGPSTQNLKELPVALSTGKDSANPLPPLNNGLGRHSCTPIVALAIVFFCAVAGGKQQLPAPTRRSLCGTLIVFCGSHTNEVVDCVAWSFHQSHGRRCASECRASNTLARKF